MWRPRLKPPPNWPTGVFKSKTKHLIPSHSKTKLNILFESTLIYIYIYAYIYMCRHIALEATPDMGMSLRVSCANMVSLPELIGQNKSELVVYHGYGPNPKVTQVQELGE